MSRHALIPSRGMVVLFPFLVGFALPATAVTDARVSESYGKLPLQFEANRGQTDKDVHFLSRGPGYSLYLTAGEAVVVLAKPNPRAKHDAKAPVKSVALRMSLVGAARKPVVSGLDEQPGKANYFIGRDPAQWRTNVPTYAKVHYQNVYPGIDLLYYGNQRQLEYDFVVAPGADPNKIVLGFKGADKLQIDAKGELVLHTKGGDIRQHKPVIYQKIDGVRRDIDGGYVRKGANRVGFQLAAYDTNRPLIIDPLVLAYSTYLGGNGFDVASGIAVDRHGNSYVTGFTSSTNFPITPGALETTFPGVAGRFSHAFVTKLDSSGSRLIYSTYLGGSNQDGGTRIAVDAHGNAYVTGTTLSTDFPITAGAFQATLTSPFFGNAFVAKLDRSGSELLYSTYLGGTQVDFTSDIAVDRFGSALVVGTAASRDFPTTPGAFQPVFAGGDIFSFFPSDAFLTKLNPTGTGLVYSTYLGGSGNDFGSGITLDALGNAYVTGRTDSPVFPTTPAAFQPLPPPPVVNGGFVNFNAFVTKFSPTGSALVYSTLLGGSKFDAATGVAVDAHGNAYVSGFTESSDFPTTAGAFQPTVDFANNPPRNFVTKLDPTGSTLVYSTYLGSSGQAGPLAVDAEGNAYVTGLTFSSTFPITAGAFQQHYLGGREAFVTKLDATGSALVYSTYLGGSGDDSTSGIALDADCNAYVSGQTTSTNFPTANAFQAAKSDGPPFFVGSDAFIAKIVDVLPAPDGGQGDDGMQHNRCLREREADDVESSEAD
jgi:Beta-propeller repeat